MTVSKGTVVYELGKPPCSGVGLRWTDGELDVALNGRVAAIVFDDKGWSNVAEILTGLANSNFAHNSLRRILTHPDQIEAWRVGEAIADTYLTDHRSCFFPWHDGRDKKRRGASLPGADLVGFGTDADGDCLAFGEVKTSSERRYPPRAVYGRTGLKRQMEDLRNDESIRDNLVRYLGHRASSAPWRTRFERAASRYLRNSSDVQLYGYLVRDVDPRPNDLRVRVDDLGVACPKGTRIELFALYLPRGRLNNIGTKMVSRRTGARR